MATKLETVIQHALRTFRHPRRKLTECSLTDLDELKSLADGITANDISSLRGLLKVSELREFLRRKKTPLDYFSVYEDDSVTVGVFLLKQGAKLPIHDHPDMYGIIKVLQGILKVTSYSFVGVDMTSENKYSSMYYNHALKVIKHPEVNVTSSDECCLLTPTDRNIHEVECIEGPAAFLDILSPPYEDGNSDKPRTCHYFQELAIPELESDIRDNYLKLIQVPSPF